MWYENQWKPVQNSVSNLNARIAIQWCWWPRNLILIVLQSFWSVSVVCRVHNTIQYASFVFLHVQSFLYTKRLLLKPPPPFSPIQASLGGLLLNFFQIQTPNWECGFLNFFEITPLGPCFLKCPLLKTFLIWFARPKVEIQSPTYLL